MVYLVTFLVSLVFLVLAVVDFTKERYKESTLEALIGVLFAVMMLQLAGGDG